MDSSDGTQDLAEESEFWMTTLPPKLKSVPIIHLAIPGSHDSMTFGITKNSGISPDARPPIQYLRCASFLIRPMLLRWSVTQSVDITQQLLAGVRYFDLRICLKQNERRFYFVHNLYSVPVEPIFERIDQFLGTHPNEVIILDFQHFYNMTPDDHAHFSHYLKLKFMYKLLPFPEDLSSVTLNYMDDRQRQIILIYRFHRPDERLFWPGTSYPTPWPATVDPGHLVEFLDRGLRNRNSNIGLVSQFVLTPTIGYACAHMCGSLEYNCAVRVEALKFDWLRKQKPGENGLNVVISDFVQLQSYRFCKVVINLNWKLLDESDLNTDDEC